MVLVAGCLYSHENDNYKNFSSSYWKNVHKSILSEETKMQNRMNLMIINVIKVYVKWVCWGRFGVYYLLPIFHLHFILSLIRKSHVMQRFTSFSTMVAWEALRCLRFDVKLPRTTELPLGGARIRQELTQL